MSDQLEMYFQTIPITKDERKEREIRTGTQNAKILQIFREYPDRMFTPFDIYRHYRNIGYEYNTPITSIRRAITTLTDMGYLEKCADTRAGEYGEKNHLWRLKKIK